MTLRALTDASLPPAVGFATTPFDASVSLALRGAALPTLAWSDGSSYTADHTGFVATPTPAGRTLRFDAATAERIRLDVLTVGPSRLVLRRGEVSVTAAARCDEEVVFATPRDFLLGLLPPPAP